MLKTRITEQYGLKVPFINAGMAFIATPPLAQAVSKAGGMGMLGISAMPTDVLQAALRDIKATNPACYGVDIIARFSGIEHIETCVAEKVPVVVFFWDDPPDEWLSRLRAAGTHIWFQVGSVDEAKAALRRGAQALVVQGSEAGGHNRAAAGTMSLLPAVIDAVPSTPVVASGGIADGRTVAAALAWAPTRSGWGPASSRASRPMPIPRTRTMSSLPASGIRLATSSLALNSPMLPRVGCATASCGSGKVATSRPHSGSSRILSFQ
jgi:NAD(P)H-dependent flavin oxidoreductase YrpB (nitropropane dioxygenase family)